VQEIPGKIGAANMKKISVKQLVMVYSDGAAPSFKKITLGKVPDTNIALVCAPHLAAQTRPLANSYVICPQQNGFSGSWPHKWNAATGQYMMPGTPHYNAANACLI
jgi:hypothetical protein